MTTCPTLASAIDQLRLKLTAALAASGLDLRRQHDGDLPFLCALYVSGRWDELAQVEWTQEAKLAFLQDQFTRQHHHYATYYDRADFMIVERGGTPIGRLGLDLEHPGDLRIVDVGIVPELRGCGIGTLLVRSVVDFARGEGRKASIHVEHHNRARHLYARLGFREISAQGPYWLMEAPAEPGEMPPADRASNGVS